jgi:hypothetical protein
MAPISARLKGMWQARSTQLADTGGRIAKAMQQADTGGRTTRAMGMEGRKSRGGTRTRARLTASGCDDSAGRTDDCTDKLDWQLPTSFSDGVLIRLMEQGELTVGNGLLWQESEEIVMPLGTRGLGFFFDVLLVMFFIFFLYTLRSLYRAIYPGLLASSSLQTSLLNVFGHFTPFQTKRIRIPSLFS